MFSDLPAKFEVFCHVPIEILWADLLPRFHFCQQDANTEFTAKCQQWVLAMLELAMLELAMLELAMLELAMLELAVLELAVLELAVLEHAGWICSRSRAQPSNLTRITLFRDELR